MNAQSFRSAKSYEGVFHFFESLPSALALIAALCLLLGGEAAQARINLDPAGGNAATEDSSPSTAPSSADSGQNTLRVPVEELGSNVVISDPKRYARAFANGPVGQPETGVASKPSALARLLPARPPSPDDPPSEDRIPEVTIGSVTFGSVKVNYRCGAGRNTLVRIEPGNVRKTLPTPAFCSAGQHSLLDSGLLPHTRYCYELSSATDTATRCATTLYRPYVFNGPNLSQAESDQMANQFDWRKTNPVMATVSTPNGLQPALYSMNILVKSEEDLYSIRGLGIHTQTQPIFSDEKEAWDGAVVHAMSPEGRPLGVWITAIVPGAIYNDLRSQAIAGLAKGQPIGIQAMVFRAVGIADAVLYPTSLITPLRAEYLGQMGLEYNGYSAVTCDDGSPRVCSVQQELGGWLLRKLISIAADVVKDVVSGVRQVIGGAERIIKGDVSLTVRLVLKNADPKFGKDELTQSGWQGTPLVLKNLPVRVYQGLAEFHATSDYNGYAHLSIAKNTAGKVCVLLDNSKVKIVSWFTAREICITPFPAMSQGGTVVAETNDRYANELAQMTDAAEYVNAVMSFTMPQVSVVTDWNSSLLTAGNGHRSFTPCMGRMPNLTANLAIYGGAAVSGLIPLLGELGEFFNAYDIVLADADIRARGVGVHEYGHAVMCEMLRKTGQAKASLAWADVIAGTLIGGQDASREQSVIAEGFADFLALQVVGGTNYVRGNTTTNSYSINYCAGDSTDPYACMETNSVRCEGALCDFSSNVKWFVSLLQDAFDRVPTSPADQATPSVYLPNDGSHWSEDTNGKLVWSAAANQVSAMDSDAIQLPGEAIGNIFSGWADRGSLLRYDSFFGGLAKALKANGDSLTDSCAMFGAHEPGGTCPDYFVTAHNREPAPASPPPVVVPPPPSSPPPVPDEPTDPGDGGRPAPRVCAKKPWTPGCDV